jgi:hypothetical protein
VAPAVSMTKLFNFLSYAMLLLVMLLGAYIVLHMWFLSERFRHKESRGTRQSERMASDNTQPVPGSPSQATNTPISPTHE